MNKSRG